MSKEKSGPSRRDKRFTAYLNGLAQAAGHADRSLPLKNYCTGLLLPGERKSVEPLAARLAPDNIRRMHQSLHHLVADAPWRDEAILSQVRQTVLPAMRKKGPIVAWVIDDTGFPKKGKYSVGVIRQYCGQVGKQENCRVAVNLSVATWDSSLPIAWRLYLPEEWTQDRPRRRKVGVPDEVAFQTKPRLALEQIRQAVEEEVARGVVLADAAYGTDSQFRTGLTELGLEYIVGVQSSTTVWPPGLQPLPPRARKATGRPPTLLRRSKNHQPLSLKHLVLALPASAWKKVGWRQGSQGMLQSRFAALRVRPANRDYWRSEPHPEQWLLVQWGSGEPEPTHYWLGTLPAHIPLPRLVALAKHRWVVERDFQELKQELGLGHFEGRGWRGFHHHATLCIAVYGFLVAERSLFSPSARVGHLGLSVAPLPTDFRPRGAPLPAGTA
jgi:SRSO17 transposase